MLCNLQRNKPVPLYHTLLFTMYLFFSFLSGLPPNNQSEWVTVEPGKGEFVSVKHRKPKPAPSHKDSLPEEGSAIKMTQQADTHQTESLLFSCPEDGCMKSYTTQGRLEQHLMYGKHEFRQAESLSLLDRAKISYAERLEAGGTHSKVTITSRKVQCGFSCLSERWAGRESAKPRHRFNSKQKRYLQKKFYHGETMGFKANPGDVSKEMRCLRDENGKRIFTVEEFLRPQQISSFFSRMACKRGDATESDNEAEEFARQQAAFHSDVIEALQQEVTHPLLFSKKNLCLMTESEIKSLKMTQIHSMASHFSIKVKGRKKGEYSDAIIAFLNRCLCKQ